MRSYTLGAKTHAGRRARIEWRKTKDDEEYALEKKVYVEERKGRTAWGGGKRDGKEEKNHSLEIQHAVVGCLLFPDAVCCSCLF